MCLVFVKRDDGIEENLEVGAMLGAIVVHRSRGCQMTAGRSTLYAEQTETVFFLMFAQDVHCAVHIMQGNFVMSVRHAILQHGIGYALVQIPLCKRKAFGSVTYAMIASTGTSQHGNAIGLFWHKNAESGDGDVGGYSVLVLARFCKAIGSWRFGIPQLEDSFGILGNCAEGE